MSRPRSRPIHLEDIQDLRPLGDQGVQAEVFSGFWNGVPVVVKTYRNRTPQELQRFQTELNILQELRHPNSVTYLGQFDSPRGFCVVMERVDGGSLRTHVFGRTKSILARIKYARDIARAMWTLHSSHGILHRDLKLANVLVTNDDVAKICDFGLSEITTDDWAQGKIGSPLYMAPEVMSNKPYNHKADVFSFAIVLWELLHQMEAFSYDRVNTTSRQAFFNHVYRGGRPIIMDEARNAFVEKHGIEHWNNIVNLMVSCWDADPQNRLDFEQIFRFLQEMYVKMNIADPSAWALWIDSGLMDKEDIPTFSQKLIAYHQNLIQRAIFDDLNLQDLFRFMKTQNFIDHNNLVTISEFGRFLGYYGPLCADPSQGIRSLLDRIRSLDRLSWFHTDVTTTQEAERRVWAQYQSTNTPCFLVRISSQRVGFFAVTYIKFNDAGKATCAHRTISFNPNSQTHPYLDISNPANMAEFGLPVEQAVVDAVYDV